MATSRLETKGLVSEFDQTSFRVHSNRVLPNKDLSQPNEDELKNLEQNNDEKNNKSYVMPFVLLFGSVVASVVNLYLLSYIIKSTGLSENGPMEGKVSWSPQLEATILELATKVSQTHLASVDSGEQELNFMLVGDENEPDSAGRVFLISNHNNFSSSSMSVGTDGQLVIDAQQLVLEFARDTQSDGKIRVDLGPQMSLAGHQDKRHLLISVDGSSDTIELSQDKVELSSATSRSLNLQGQLKSPKILGSLDEDLRLESRDGDLNLDSSSSISIKSKAGSVQLESDGEVSLTSDQMHLSAGEIRLSEGIEFFDQLPEANTGDANELPATTSDSEETGSLSGNDHDRDERTRELDEDIGSGSGNEEDHQEPLRAYSVVANGVNLLVAS